MYGLGTSRFRVEEYKRPEFEVTVSAPTEAKRPGETVAARINAKYYFGAPVPNAKVKYHRSQKQLVGELSFSDALRLALRQLGRGQITSTGRRNIGGEGSGKIIKEGEVTSPTKTVSPN